MLWLARRFDEAGIPYMISGSIALSVYITPRMTRDLDVIVEAPAEAGRLIAVFGDRFYLEPAAVDRAIETRRMFNAIHMESLFKIDVIIRKDSAFRLEEFRRRRQVQFAGTPVWVVSAEDLLLSKLEWWAASQSALQWTDLVALARAPMDWRYLQEWAPVLGLAEHLRKLHP